MVRQTGLGVLLWLLACISAWADITIEESTYISWEGVAYDTYLIESASTVIHIDRNELEPGQIDDIETLTKLVNRVDALYDFYATRMGYEPPGGNPDRQYKAEVFFGTPSCGSGCGLVGAKGIEVSGFRDIFHNLKHDLNVNRDVIIAYEFGRNFFTFEDKILFPFTPNTDEKNGGFAEGFASLMVLYAFDAIMANPDQRALNETLLNLEWNLANFRGYINDVEATPSNSLAKWSKQGIQDPNRGAAGWRDPSYAAGSLLIGLFETFGRDKLFPAFFAELLDRPDALTMEDSLSNIAYAASFALNRNLAPFFENVLKFDLNPDTRQEIEGLPPVASTLIRDQATLWFLSPFESIPLNLKSTNYLVDNLEYRVLIDGEFWSSSLSGLNEIPYAVMQGESEKVLTVQLLNDGEVIDAYEIALRKRDEIDILAEQADALYAYYLGNSMTGSHIEDGALVISRSENETVASGLVRYDLVFSRDREYEVTAEIRQLAKDDLSLYAYAPFTTTTGWSNIAIDGPVRGSGSARVGFDVGFGDSVFYYPVEAKTEGGTSSFMEDETEYFKNRISFSMEGHVLEARYRNVIFRDVTDTDADGVRDFQDDLPLDKMETVDTDRDGTGDNADDDDDGDGLPDDVETELGLDPLLRDTDSDGMEDGAEDSDNDGFNNLLEVQSGTDPGRADSVPEIFVLNAGLNDAWYNPLTNGQGFFISVFPERREVFVAWFTFDLERPEDGAVAHIGEPGHRWLTAQGPFELGTATLTIHQTQGGIFDSAQPPALTGPAGIGSMTIEFADCAQALVTYELHSLGRSREIPIQRVAGDNVKLCEELRVR